MRESNVWTNDRKAREGMSVEKGRHIKPGKDTKNCYICTMFDEATKHDFQLVEITGLYVFINSHLNWGTVGGPLTILLR